MYLPKPIKILANFTVIFAASCNYWQGDSGTHTATAPFAAEEVKTEIPFASKEPELYRAEIVLTNYTDGEKTERRIFTARRGEKRRNDYENEISFLQSAENLKFSLHNGKKIYAESTASSGASGATNGEMKDFLRVEWLNEKRAASFEKLGAENNLTKYVVRLKDAPNKNSETLIFVDENLQMPVRQEFYTMNGERKILVFSMEMRDARLEADDRLFELPKNYRKVTAQEFQRIIRQKDIKK